MVLIYPYYFNEGVNKIKTVDYCWLCDYFGCYFGINNYFWVIVSIWYIHVLQYYKFRPCNPNFQENTNINKKYKKKFSPKSFQNYYIGVTSLNLNL